MKTISPFKYSGSIRAPRSKSYLQRAIAIATLMPGKTKINGYTASNDALAATAIARNLGATCTLEGDSIIVDGIGEDKKHSVSLNSGEAGLSTRMFSPIAASLYSDVHLDGEGSILVRPMDMVIDALEQLGAKVSSNESKLPLHIEGGVSAGEIHIDGSESSQLLTGLLIALAFLPEKSVVHVANLKSIPYIQMTLDILKEFGLNISHDDFKTFYIDGVDAQKLSNNIEYDVEGDWSGASFHVAGAAISGVVTITGMNPNSAQADLKIIEAARLAGAEVLENVDEQSVTIKKKALKGFEFDATHCPDLFPPLAALAACCEGTTRIIGTDRLTHKESNRALTIQEELGKLGVKIDLQPNVMEITGGVITGGTVSSRNDHRIAMMAAILATVTDDTISIEDPDAVNKSYPSFYEDLESLN